MRSRQAILHRPGQFELAPRPVPDPGPGELIVRVDLALTCGTDLKTYRRGHSLFPCPTPMGHEYTGTIARVGAGVARWREGDAIMAVPSAPCGVCGECRRGDENLCGRIRGADMAWGAFADWIRVPAHVAARNVFPRPNNLTLHEAALLEPLSCVVSAAARVPVWRGPVLIVGAGPMGLLFTTLLAERGVGPIAVLGRREARLEAARAMGAQVVLDEASLEDPAAAVREALGEEPGVVVECVGRSEAWALALRLVRRGGEVLFYGGCAKGATLEVDAHRLHYHALCLRGAFHFTPSDVRIALDLLQSRRLRWRPLISGDRPLSALPEVFAELERGEVIKLGVVPDGTQEEL